jgi:hypothetical protein
MVIQLDRLSVRIARGKEPQEAQEAQEKRVFLEPLVLLVVPSAFVTAVPAAKSSAETRKNAF